LDTQFIGERASGASVLLRAVGVPVAGGWDDLASGVTARPGQTKGDAIREAIEANRQKRLAIGEAMKAEAGVTGHEVNRHDDGGWARLQTGLINSPEGRTIKKLETLAHECGHIFLHGIGKPGFLLAPHVMEMEAESYAHQALKVYGMHFPRDRSDWGRRYVGTWVEKDRAKGIPIDPRVLAYVAGTRSPYELLRDIPETWRKAGYKSLPVVEVPKPKPVPVAVVAAPTVVAVEWSAAVRRATAWLSGNLGSVGLAAWVLLLCEIYIDHDDFGTTCLAYATAATVMLGHCLTRWIDRSQRWLFNVGS
jgi:hypothetical protein